MIGWFMWNIPRFERLYYRFRCPYPINGKRQPRDCFDAGMCGCQHQDRYTNFLEDRGAS